MRIPEKTLEAIGNRLAIEDVIGEYVTLKKQGTRYLGLCPFHSEKTPSFSVDSDKKLFHCFGCKKGGTLFTFIMEIEKMTFPEAVQFLAKKAGIEIKGETSADRELESKKNALKELYNRVTQSLNYLLLEKKREEILNYLLKRGLNLDIINKFSLGYYPEDPRGMYRFLQKKGYSSDFLATSGLFSSKHPDYFIFTGRIIFPIKDLHGNTIAFGGRSLKERGPKYINSPDTLIFKKSENLFGFDIALSSLRKKESVFIVEGYMDLLALHTAGVENVVAPLGTAFTEEQLKRLKRYIKRGYLLFDSDSAGQEATKRTIEICQKSDFEISVVQLAGGKDPAEILEKQGKDALNNSLKYSITSFEYLINMILTIHNKNSPEGKNRILQDIFPYIKNNPSAVTREAYFKELSELLDIEYSTVLEEYSREKKHNKDNIKDNIYQIEKIKQDISPELYLMFAVASNMEKFRIVRSMVKYEDFEDPQAKEIYIALEELFRKDNNDTNALLFRIEDLKLKEQITEKITSGEFNVNQEKLINDSILQIKQNSLERKRKEVERLLRKYENDNSRREYLRELLEEKIYLDKELTNLRFKN